MGIIISGHPRRGATVIRLLLGAVSFMVLVLGIVACVSCLIWASYLAGQVGPLLLVLKVPAFLVLIMACKFYESIYRFQESLVESMEGTLPPLNMSA